MVADTCIVYIFFLGSGACRLINYIPVDFGPVGGNINSIPQGASIRKSIIMITSSAIVAHKFELEITHTKSNVNTAAASSIAVLFSHRLCDVLGAAICTPPCGTIPVLFLKIYIEVTPRDVE